MSQPSSFDEDRSMPVHGAGITDVTGTAGGTYTATEQTLINDLKAKVNALLAAAREAGLIQLD